MDEGRVKSRWPDERVDDLANELRSLRNLPNTIAELRVEMRGVKEDLNALFSQSRELSEDFARYRQETREEVEARRRERKSDLKWIIGTIIAAGALIIAAVGLLIG